MTARIASVAIHKREPGGHYGIVRIVDDQRPGFSLTDFVDVPDPSPDSYAMVQAHGYLLVRRVNTITHGLPSAYPVDPDKP